MSIGGIADLGTTLLSLSVLSSLVQPSNKLGKRKAVKSKYIDTLFTISPLLNRNNALSSKHASQESFYLVNNNLEWGFVYVTFVSIYRMRSIHNASYLATEIKIGDFEKRPTVLVYCVSVY